ncbi:MAG TPA: GNAT family N-acetyltransferase [Gaiellaceae bacterium]|nr:GNAT family N-acetyltransferase [Gaiellaceae bacterium]
MADFSVRRAEPGDLGDAYSLFAAWQESLYGEAEIGPAMFESSHAAADASYVAEAGGAIVGLAGVRGGEIDLLVEPSFRRRRIGTALLEAAESGAEDDVLLLDSVTLDPTGAPFAAANGYAKAWEYWLMGLDLPGRIEAAGWPEGVSVRAFREEDVSEVKELLDLAYSDDPYDNPMTLEHWRRFMLEDPSFDPAVWFLAVAGDELVGAALHWKEGFVKDLVVHPDWRRRGIGRSLLLHAFGTFAERGIRRITLKTDSINPTQAWRLYEHLGFRKERTYEVFEKRR